MTYEILIFWKNLKKLFLIQSTNISGATRIVDIYHIMLLYRVTIAPFTSILNKFSMTVVYDRN